MKKKKKKKKKKVIDFSEWDDLNEYFDDPEDVEGVRRCQLALRQAHQLQVGELAEYDGFDVWLTTNDDKDLATG